MTETEDLLAELIWEQEPIRSGELVKLASQRLGWKKATRYAVLRKLCENDIFQNKGAVVSAKVSREEYTARQEELRLQENHNSVQIVSGTDFPRRKKSGRNDDIKERVALVDDQKNGLG